MKDKVSTSITISLRGLATDVLLGHNIVGRETELTGHGDSCFINSC